MGTQPAVEVDVQIVDLANEDRIMLCSDGLSGYLDDAEDAAGLVEAGGPQATSDRLVTYAEEEGGTDNITAVVVDVSGLDEAADSDPVRAVEVLGECAVFADLSLRDLMVVHAAGRLEHREVGEVLVRERARVSRIYIVVAGEVAAYTDGVEAERFEVGRMIGGRTLMEPRSARATLRAVTDVAVLRFEGAALRRLFLRRPLLGVRVLGRLNRRLHRDAKEDGSA